jgi:hypothetical protein
MKEKFSAKSNVDQSKVREVTNANWCR